MRTVIFLSALAAASIFPVHAGETEGRKSTWTPPVYGAAAAQATTPRSPFADGFAPRKPGRGTQLLTAATVIALQSTSFAHLDVVHQANIMGDVPSGNPGRSGDRNFLGDKSMDNGIR